MQSWLNRSQVTDAPTGIKQSVQEHILLMNSIFSKETENNGSAMHYQILLFILAGFR